MCSNQSEPNTKPLNSIPILFWQVRIQGFCKGGPSEMLPILPIGSRVGEGCGEMVTFWNNRLTIGAYSSAIQNFYTLYSRHFAIRIFGPQNGCSGVP